MEKRVLKVFIMVAVLVIAITTVVQAASFTASMTPSSTAVAPETEFTVTVKISNLDVGSNGINALSGFLKYDSDVFEVINSSSIEGINEWKPSFSSENGKVTLTKTQFVKTEEEVFQITFKTRDAEKLSSKKSGTITFTSVVASNSEKDITASDVSTTINIAEATSNTTNATNNTANSLVIKSNTISSNTTNKTANNTTNNTTNNKTNNVVNNAVGSTISTNNTVSNYTTNTVEEDIPYTGVEDTVKYLMFAVIAVALVFYVKFEKINRDIK